MRKMFVGLIVKEEVEVEVFEKKEVEEENEFVSSFNVEKKKCCLLRNRRKWRRRRKGG